jgi:hypothetical protein
MRDDQTALCVRCGLRQEQTERCLRCGRATRDLRDPEHRAVNLAVWRERFVASRSRALYRSAPSAKSSLVGFVSAGGLVGAGMMCFGVAELVIEIIVFAVSLFLVALAIGLAWHRLSPRTLVGAKDRPLLDAQVELLAKKRAAALELRTPPMPVDATDTVEGRVVATRLETPPFGDKAGVAWRVVGDGPGGRIDEGRVIEFDLETDGGELVRVDVAGSALAALDAAEPHAVELSKEQAEYLDARGLQSALGPVELGITVLAPGDRAIVAGRFEERAAADGYRGTRLARWLTGRPIVVRTAGRTSEISPDPDP